jgi:diguanylate cyclase (GGDEF)-like protein
MVRVSLLGAAVIAACAGLFAITPGSPQAILPVPWWGVVLLAVGFAFGQLVVFHLEFRLDVVTVSVNEVPMAFALFFVDVRLAIVMWVVVASAVSCRPRPPELHKWLFNMCVFLCDAVVATFVFRSIVERSGDSVVASIVAAVLGTLAMSLVSAVIVRIAIAQFAGGFWELVRVDLRTSTWVFALNGLLGGLTVAPALLSPWLTPLGLVPIAAMWLLVREYCGLRTRFDDLEAMHGFAAGIADVVDLRHMIDVAVEDAARLMHARQAAILVFADGGLVGAASCGPPIDGLPRSVDDPTWSSMLAGGSRTSAHHRADGCLAAVIRGDSATSPCVLTDGIGQGNGNGARPIDVEAVRTGVGLVVVGGRDGMADAFDDADAQRLQNIADQLAAGMGRSLLHRRVQHEASHDPLTGLPNRSSFEQALLARCSDVPAGADDGDLFVVMFDLDRFKEVNDTLGHHAGDQVLVQFAWRIGLLLAPDDLLARFAGDEFALFGRRADADAIDEFLRTCIDATGRPFALDGLEVVVTVSAGVAIAMPDDDPAELVRRADVAMYHAKTQHLGHDFHREEIDRRTPARLSMLTDLRAAIHGEEIQIHFQPKLDLATDRVSGVEALARWHHPTRGWVPPVDFIKVAEESGLIRSLTDHVIGAAVEALARVHTGGHALGLAVNLSTQDLFDELLGDRIERRLDQFGIAADQLTFEITEGSLLVDGPRTRSTIDRLHRIGVRLSIDDFGTGYSSLSYLRKLPVTELKIDRSFVTDLLTEQQDEVIVRSTIDLGHNLGMTVVAEGAESRAVVEQLRTMGCDVVQGFGIARPMPLGALEQWLADRLDPPLDSRPLAAEATSVS